MYRQNDRCDVNLHINLSDGYQESRKLVIGFLASRDQCPGSLCHSPSVGVCALTKTLTLAITFKPLKIKLSYFICAFLMTKTFHLVP